MKEEVKIKDKKNHKSERIIEAASSLFSEMDFHEVMMEDIAKTASVAKGTLYNYFPSKDDLYFSIIAVRLENLITHLREKIENEKNPYEVLRLFTSHTCNFFVNNKCFYLIMQKESLNKKSELCNKIKNRQNELKEILKNILESGKANKCISVSNVELAAEFILGAINGIVNFTLNKNPEEHLQNQDEMFNYLLNGLSKNSIEVQGKQLGNKIIVFTGSVDDQVNSAEKLKKTGARIISFPTIEIIPPSEWKSFDKNIKQIGKFNYLIFTSANAVRMFRYRCNESGIVIDYSELLVAVIGRKTADVCKSYNIPVDIIPEEFNAEGLIRELSKYDIKGKKFFIPCSEIARDELEITLQEKGAEVLTVPVYNIGVPSKEILAERIDELKRSKPDLFIFTSPSTYKNFLQIMNISEPQLYFRSFEIAAIGPTTKAEIEGSDVNVNIIPDEYNIDGLVNSIINYYK